MQSNSPSHSPVDTVANAPHVAIILLNYNNAPDTMACVDSLRELSYKNYSIIVVDNASPDGSGIELQKKFPDLTVILNRENGGFAAGNNVGILRAIGEKSEYLWILNNDTVVQPDSLSKLVDCMESDVSIGMCGCGIVYYSNPEIVWSWGGSLKFPFFDASPIGLKKQVVGFFGKDVHPEIISGCSQFVRTSVIDKIGLMPECYFMYWEDVEWCYRIKKQGYKLAFVSEPLVLHKEGMTFGKSNPLKYFYKFRNRMLFIKRNLSFGESALSYVGVLFQIIYNSIVLMLRGNFSGFAKLCKGLLAGVYYYCKQ